MVALVPELSVFDIKASLHFYRDLIGFSVRYERQEEGFAYLSLGAAEIMLDQIGVGRDWVTADLEPPLGRGINLQVEVSEIEPIAGRLEAFGIALFMAPETRTYRVGGREVVQRQFCVQDPDGYLLRFCQGTK